LLGAFDYHYLKRGSWRSRAEFIDYVGQTCPEYNRLYAHPFEWTWSSQKMRQWVKNTDSEFLALFHATPTITLANKIVTYHTPAAY